MDPASAYILGMALLILFTVLFIGIGYYIYYRILRWAARDTYRYIMKDQEKSSSYDDVLNRKNK